ncbi:hypothetical protein [Segetibacter aerophilus]|uniref:Uncharacterized protein n=1 Tax=Segetibacter aerophilus TaxID=670293 RepID=A0A512B9S1_9BACT|nr:hypothetical protein [Segetibacter aerophilus]GEO08716.1 hypothetical protein SAE01_12120 [Segetibacter aerophilus]
MQTSPEFFFVKNTKFVVAVAPQKEELENLIPSHAYYQKLNGELVRAEKLDGYYPKSILVPVPKESIYIN